MRVKRLLIVAIMLIALSAATAYAQPTGAKVTQGAQERGTVSITPGNATAAGGNITPVNLTSKTITEAWHGFYGQIVGNITLEDSAGFRMYAWAFNQTGGEMFASRSNAVSWAVIAAHNDCTIDQDLTGTGSDRTNMTFTPSANTAFTVGGVPIGANSACTTYTYVNNASQAADFEEVILFDNSTNTSVYTCLLELDTTGFDGGAYDFQIIVPDNRTTAVETYYFYAELS